MVNIRYAKKEDSSLLLEWVNKSDSLEVKIESNNVISEVEHSKWFIERLNDNDTHIWIILNKDNVPIGQIRFQRKVNKYFDIDIYIVEEERRRGIAGKALNIASGSLNSIFLRSIVKKNNLKNNNKTVICGKVDTISSGFFLAIIFNNFGNAYLKFDALRSMIFFFEILHFKEPLVFCITKYGSNKFLSIFSIKLVITLSAPPTAKDGNIIKTVGAFIFLFFYEDPFKFIF